MSTYRASSGTAAAARSSRAVHLLGRLVQRVRGSSLGAERRGQVLVHLGGGRAEPVGLAGEVAAGLARR